MTLEARPAPPGSRPARDPGAPAAGRTRRPRPVVWVGRAVVGLGCSVLLGPPWFRADIGAIDRSLPFAVLKAKSHVNARAKAANDDPRFSVWIREGLPRMALDRGSGGATR